MREERLLQTEDFSVAGLARKNLSGHLGIDEGVTVATLPTGSSEVLDVIAGFTHVQFVATDTGKLLLMGYEAEGRLTVIHMNAGS